MQYLAWVQDASRHVLVSDLFVLRGTPHDYLQPMIAISGGLVALGMSPWLALLVWKPVAVIAIFVAVRACCHRALAGRGERRAALALGLFAAGWASWGEEWILFLSWGYLYALIALARASPNIFTIRSSPSTNEMNTQTMIAAAAVTTRPVEPTPSITAPVASRLRVHASWTRDTRDTS